MSVIVSGQDASSYSNVLLKGCRYSFYIERRLWSMKTQEVLLSFSIL